MKRITFLIAMLLFAVSTGARASGDNCYMVLAGRSATADGSVLLAHNEDNGLQYPVRMELQYQVVSRDGKPERSLDNGASIPAPDTTWAYWILRMPGLDFSHVLMNEKGVAVVSDNCPSREDMPELIDGGVGPCLRILVAERARSAREGARLVGELVGRYGYNSSGRTLTIADSREGWLVAMVNGRHWVAIRVPDDSVAVLANCYSLHRVDLADSLNYMGSQDIVEYAVRRGWYDPSTEGEFDFARAYSRPDLLSAPNQTHRQWSGIEQVAPGAAPTPDRKLPLPFCVAPSRGLTPRDLFAVLRDHYEATPYARGSFAPHTPDYGPGGPICNFTTNSGSVFQLRGDMPVALGSTWWLALCRPCASPFVPLYPWAGQVPPELEMEPGVSELRPSGMAPRYGPDTALNVFRDFSLFVDQKYWENIGWCQLFWPEFERRSVLMQAEMEKYARAVYRENPEFGLDILNRFSRGTLSEAMQRARGSMGR